jgi:hypothetical protein
MKVFLHAGVHRTGSTALQFVLSENRSALAEQGVIYPGDGVHHQALAWELHRGKADVRNITRLFEGVSVGDDATVLLSAEDFSIHRNLGWLVKLAKRCPVEAVFYLRRQDHWLMSWYNQHIKWPFDKQKSKMDPETFLGHYQDFFWIDYDWLLDRWANVLGNDKIHVRIVEPGQVEHVQEDFANLVGFDLHALPASRARHNDSLPVHMLELARHFGLYEMPAKQRVATIAALREGLGHIDPGAKTLYPPDQRRWLLQQFEASNRRVAARWFGRKELFQEAWPDRDAPYYRMPALSPEDLLDEWVQPVLRSLAKRAR